MTSEPDLSKRRWLNLGKARPRPANRLPWSVDWSRFTADCHRCGDCLSACPENIIVAGDGGFPVLDFSLGECTFCGRCVETCNQNIFVALNESPWHQQAQVKEGCLTDNGVFCRSCEDSCEVGAIRFRPRLGGISRPELDMDACNGCGACVAGCPTRAIKIEVQESA